MKRSQLLLAIVASTVALLMLSWAASAATAAPTLPLMFSDHMVLERDVPVPVWGWAEPNEEITVTFSGQKKSTEADEKGQWRVTLDPLKAAGKPQELIVHGRSLVRIQDVLVGEVWLASGQSNMVFTVARGRDASKEIAAGNYPQLRMFTVACNPAQTPQTRCQGTWQVCSPKTVGSFSATAYFFGRELHQQLGVPVGLINASVGGTPIEAWTSLEAQKSRAALAPVLRGAADAADAKRAQDVYEKQLAHWKKMSVAARKAGQTPPQRPKPPKNRPTTNVAVLYNGMIAPLGSFAMRGAIWYQGERNTKFGPAHLYGAQLETLIGDWRRQWQRDDLPLLWVQLPNFGAQQKAPVEDTGWVQVQAGMLKTLAVPHTGMAVTIDVGDARNIHPKDKQPVGRRLALWALSATYGKSLVHSGPLYKAMTADGNKAVITFDHVGGGLAARDGGKLRGFAVAGADKKFVWAEATIVGDTVEVSGAERPVAVRYAWAPNPTANLVNREGLPASPFRTDNW